MRRKWIQFGTELVEVGVPEVSTGHIVQDDIHSFQDTTGAIIGGRRQWREHLRRLGAEEFGRSDLQSSMERQVARLETWRAANLPDASSPQLKSVERSKAACRLLERLDGRPAPDRKTLIKMAIEERQRGRD